MSWSPSNSLALAEARVGTVLRGKWRLDRMIGLGGMAAVYAATHRTGHVAAIKVLHQALANLEEVRLRFVQEPYIANRINHGGVVRVLDDDVGEDGAPFVVMELLEGETLDDLRQRSGGRLPVEEVTWIADQLLDILTAAHAVGILHRDVKPQNAFLTRQGAMKLLDFGVARMREGSSTMTVIGGVLGSPAFMPPEQALARWDLVGERVDVWAVGATMFTLLTGEYVHQASTAIDFLVAATQPARSLATAAPRLPSSIIQLVDRALAHDPALRWPSARAMQTALREAEPSRDEPTAVMTLGGTPVSALAQAIQAPPQLQSRVGPSGTMLIRDSFPDWSVESAPSAEQSGGWPAAPAPAPAVPAPGARTEILPAEIPSLVDVPEASGLWYVSDGTRVVGPVSLDLLRRGIAAGRVPEDSLVRHESWSEWRAMGEAMGVISSDDEPTVSRGAAR